MTLGEFAGAFNNKKPKVELELRNVKDQTICICHNKSSVISVYEDCEIFDWWVAFIERRVVIHIDDTLVTKKLKKED